MKKTWSFFIIGGLVIAVSIAIIYLLIWFIYANWANFNPNTITAVAAALIGGGFAIKGYSEARKRETAARHFIEKKNAYTGFITFICKISSQSNQKNKVSQKEMRAEAEKFIRVLVTWGSSETIQAYEEFSRNTETDDNEDISIVLIDDLLCAIRKDLGHDNAGIKRGDIVGLFLDDASKVVLKDLITKITP